MKEIFLDMVLEVDSDLVALVDVEVFANAMVKEAEKRGLSVGTWSVHEEYPIGIRLRFLRDDFVYILEDIAKAVKSWLKSKLSMT